MLGSVFRTLAIVLVALGASPSAAASGAGGPLLIAERSEMQPFLRSCSLSHPIEMCQRTHWHGVAEFLAPDTPRPKPSGKMLVHDPGPHNPQDRTAVVAGANSEIAYDVSLSTLYLTTERLRL